MFIDLLEDAIDVKDRSERLYVIGDIHGCATALKDILKQIADDIIDKPPVGVVNIIFVGDYIDRGPENYDVIEIMCNLVNNPSDALYQYNDNFPRDNPKRFYIQVITLSGNHEIMFKNAIKGSTYCDALNEFRFSDDSEKGIWLRNGGSKVVDQYCEKLKIDYMMLPVHHIRFFDQLEDYFTLIHCGPDKDQTWVIVHAGVYPALPLNKQNAYDIKWIREEYYNFDFTVCNDTLDGKKRIIGGHTPVKSVVSKGGKLMIDTGCVFGNKLTCVVLETENQFEDFRILESEQPGIEKKF